MEILENFVAFSEYMNFKWEFYSWTRENFLKINKRAALLFGTLEYVLPVKYLVEISQNFVAFSEYMNFKIFTWCSFKTQVYLVPKNGVTFFRKGGRGPNLFTDETGCCCWSPKDCWGTCFSAPIGAHWTKSIKLNLIYF